MRLSEIMSSPVETIARDATVAAARAAMRRRRIHHLVVMDGVHMAGVVSSRDLAGAPSEAPIAERMSESVVSASAHDTVRDTANRLRGHGVGCLPIVERGRLVGIVTISDLLALLGKGAVRPVERGTRWTLRRRDPRRERHRELAR